MLLRFLRLSLFFLWAGSGWAAPRPNVIIILADDLGWGDLGVYGHRFATPHLDRMAAEGARLTDFYVPNPYCAPSRAALLTGRYPFRNGMTRNPFPAEDLAGIGNADALGIAESELLLSEVFHKHGYATCHIGKWHLGHQPRYYPTRHGFAEYYGILYSNDMHPVRLIDGETAVEYPVVQATLTRRYTERAQAFIRRHRDQPFFLYLAHAMPHKPLACSDRFYTPQTRQDLYADVMAELDWSVGEVLKTLRDLDLERHTLVLFTSDNGPWYGGFTGGLRGMKGRTAEGGIRVPLLARWPGRIPAGHVSHQPAIIMDLFATTLRVCGIPLPNDRTLDGRDIWPLLTSSAPTPHEALFSMRGETLSTIRAGRWKLHVNVGGPAREKIWQPDEEWVDPRGPDGVRLLAPYEQYHPSDFPGVLTGDAFTPMALFDLEEDRAEQKDVAAAHPEEVRRLRDLFDNMVAVQQSTEQP